MTEFTVQCEGCGEQVPESDAEFTHPPGATLAWCPDCASKSYAEEVL